MKSFPLDVPCSYCLYNLSILSHICCLSTVVLSLLSSFFVKRGAKREQREDGPAEPEKSFSNENYSLEYEILTIDNEPATVEIMNKYIAENGYENDFSDTRFHHEIYLSDARKVAPEKWKTVIRHPIKHR